MADDFFNNSKFYLEIDGITDLFIKQISGPQITMEIAGDAPTLEGPKGEVTQTQATIGVKYNSSITLTLIANETARKTLEDWYIKCHAEGSSGETIAAPKNGKNGSLTIYDGEGEEMIFEFTDLFPYALKQIGSLDNDQSGQQAEDTLELKFTKLVRKQ